MRRQIGWLAGPLVVALASGPIGAMVGAELPDATWELASRRTGDDLAWTVYVETDPMPGRPAFRIETTFDVLPSVAAATLMEEMSEPGSTTTGEHRRLLEQGASHALVHSYVDLPFMFSDRELAIRVEYSDDTATGVHRIDWRDENERLPPPEDGVLRLRAEGYWEFRPAVPNTTNATYVTRAEVGGSLPTGLRDRLMKRQAIDAVERLHKLIATRGDVKAAAPPPEAGGSGSN